MNAGSFSLSLRERGCCGCWSVSIYSGWIEPSSDLLNTYCSFLSQFQDRPVPSNLRSVQILMILNINLQQKHLNFSGWIEHSSDLLNTYCSLKLFELVFEQVFETITPIVPSRDFYFRHFGGVFSNFEVGRVGSLKSNPGQTLFPQTWDLFNVKPNSNNVKY